MSTKNASPLTGAVILAGFVIVALSVLLGVRGKLESQDHHGHVGHHASWAEVHPHSDPVQTEVPVPAVVLAGSEPNFRPGAKVRTLQEFYSRRAYAGAPPVIPHPVRDDGLINNDCLSCHQDGGFVPEYNCYTPITPHPEMGNCRQCHVSQNAKTLFRETEWIQPDLPKRGRQAIPGGPLLMPHSLHMRENCMACHAGPQAVVEIRSSHPERSNCRQCHVPDMGQPAFQSLIDTRKDLAHAEN